MAFENMRIMIYSTNFADCCAKAATLGFLFGTTFLHIFVYQIHPNDSCPLDVMPSLERNSLLEVSMHLISTPWVLSSKLY